MDMRSQQPHPGFLSRSFTAPATFIVPSAGDRKSLRRERRSIYDWRMRAQPLEISSFEARLDEKLDEEDEDAFWTAFAPKEKRHGMLLNLSEFTGSVPAPPDPRSPATYRAGYIVPEAYTPPQMRYDPPRRAQTFHGGMMPPTPPMVEEYETVLPAKGDIIVGPQLSEDLKRWSMTPPPIPETADEIELDVFIPKRRSTSSLGSDEDREIIEPESSGGVHLELEEPKQELIIPSGPTYGSPLPPVVEEVEEEEEEEEDIVEAVKDAPLPPEFSPQVPTIKRLASPASIKEIIRGPPTVVKEQAVSPPPAPFPEDLIPEYRAPPAPLPEDIIPDTPRLARAVPLSSKMAELPEPVAPPTPDEYIPEPTALPTPDEYIPEATAAPIGLGLEIPERGPETAPRRQHHCVLSGHLFIKHCAPASCARCGKKKIKKAWECVVSERCGIVVCHGCRKEMKQLTVTEEERVVIKSKNEMIWARWEGESIVVMGTVPTKKAEVRGGGWKRAKL